MDSLEDRLKEKGLTKAHRSIAEFCLQNKHLLPLLSSAEIARQAGVSDVSVIRFARALGYENFSAFKHSIQQEIAGAAVPATLPSPIVRYVSTRAGQRDSAETTVEDAKSAYQEVINNLFAKNTPAVFDQAAKLILGSRNRYVMGIRFRSSVAEICVNLLRMTTPSVYQVPDTEYTAFQLAMDFSQDDCLIWFSFGRFTNFERQMLKFVQRSGIRLIVIADERASRIALEANLFIQSYGHHANMPFYSSMANCIIAEQIANAVTSLGWVGAEDRLREYEANLTTMTVQETP